MQREDERACRKAESFRCTVKSILSRLRVCVCVCVLLLLLLFLQMHACLVAKRGHIQLKQGSFSRHGPYRGCFGRVVICCLAFSFCLSAASVSSLRVQKAEAEAEMWRKFRHKHAVRDVRAPETGCAARKDRQGLQAARVFSFL